MIQVKYDDIDRINARSTRELWSPWGRERCILASQIETFAGLTENKQWIHSDTERTRNESPYGGRIVHGLFLVTLIPGLFPTVPFEVVRYRVRIIRGVNALRLPSPVFPGEHVRVRTRNQWARKAESGKGTIVAHEVELWSRSGQKPAVTGEWLLQYF